MRTRRRQRGGDSDALFDAVYNNKLDQVKSLLDRGADVNKANDIGDTPLYIASDQGHTEIVKLLLEKDADVNKHGNHGAPLYIATIKGHTNIVKLLLNKDADVNKADVDNQTPLIIASAEGHTDIVKLLLEKGADVNKVTKYDETALFNASKGGHTEIVKLLLEKGAPITDKIRSEMETFTEEIQELLEGKKRAIWKGWTRSDSEKLDTIFSDEMADDYACCPFCLKFVERSEACNYMKHDCSKMKGHYHVGLYNKYNNEGYVGWCTICGRPALGHTHCELNLPGDVKAGPVKDATGMVLMGRPFEKDCRVSSGGGGLPEKLARFRRMREFAKELEEEEDELSEQKVLEMMVEEAWKAPLVRKPSLNRIMKTKTWNIPHTAFKENVAPAAAEEALVLRNIERPEANANNPDLQPIVYESGTNTLIGDEDVKVVQFRHRQDNGSINKHENDRISLENLAQFLETKVKNFGEAGFGYCYMYPDCKAKLYPSEIKGLVTEEGPITNEMYEKYKEKFNAKFQQTGGGMSEGFFVEAENAVCVLPTAKRGGKSRKGRKTRKMRSKPKRKTRKN
jgi:hypothetical protein